jgi:inosine-uridine nucleoside N-ribohydrolase
METPPALRRVVLDTDTYNEVDDQFALAHLLLSPDRVALEAVHAAPFFNSRSTGPADGMEKSYEEILRVIDLVNPAARPPVFRGSRQYLPAAGTPVESDAARDLVERAMATDAGKLHVVGIAAATNIASALLMEPRIARRIVIVWLGGHAPYWPHTREFNLGQDLHAARVLLEAEAPLVLAPCHPVTSHMITTVAELEAQLAPHSELGRYLTDIVRGYAGNPPGWSKVIWDIAATAWVINPAWLKAEEAPAPILNDDVTWSSASGRRTIRVVREVNRDAILADFFSRARTISSVESTTP